MKRISAIAVFSGIMLAAGMAAFVWITIVRPMQSGAGGDGDGTPLPASEIVPESRIAFVSDRDGDQEIYTMRPDGSDVVQITHNDVLDMSPQWSPDGKRIAWLSEMDGQRDLYVMNLDGSGVIRLSNSNEFEFEFDWSPDGQWIAYALAIAVEGGVEDGIGNGYYVVNSVTAEVEWDGGGSQLDWQPEGGLLAFVESELDSDSDYVMAWNPLTGGTGYMAYFFETYEGVLSRPAWNPADSTQLAAVGSAVEGESTRIYLMQLLEEEGNFSEPLALTEPMNITLIEWSPYGSFLAFYSWNDGTATPSADVYVMDMIARTDPVRVDRITEPMGFDWSPDEAQIVYASLGADGEYAIYITESDKLLVDDQMEHEIIAHDAMMPDWSPILMPSVDAALPTLTAPEVTETLEAIATPTETPTGTPDQTVVITADSYTPDDQSSSLQISNFGVPYCYLYIVSSANVDDWGENWLEAGQVIETDQLVRVEGLAAGTYDFKTEDCSPERNITSYKRGEELRARQEVHTIFSASAILIIENESTYDLCYLDISPITDTAYGRNLFSDEAPLAAGSIRRITTTGGSWDLRVIACSSDGEPTIDRYGESLGAGDNLWTITNDDYYP